MAATVPQAFATISSTAIRIVLATSANGITMARRTALFRVPPGVPTITTNNASVNRAIDERSPAQTPPTANFEFGSSINDPLFSAGMPSTWTSEVEAVAVGDSSHCATQTSNGRGTISSRKANGNNQCRKTAGPSRANTMPAMTTGNEKPAIQYADHQRPATSRTTPSATSA